MNTATTLYAAGPATGTLAPVAPVLQTWYPAPIEDRISVTSPDQGAEVLLPYVSGSDRERCVVALLDTKHRLLGVELASVGSIDHTFMHPRDLLRSALLANASAMVIAHNHPSGDPEPSRDDEVITRRIVKASETVGVDMLDHLVFGGTRWVSLARRGLT